MLRRVVLLASASPVAAPDELAAAERAARGLAENGIMLVYEGHALGPAGAAASVALGAQGRVVGVVLAGQATDTVNDDLTERRPAASPDEQRALLRELADAYLALPGAVRSLHEVLELSRPDTGREVPVGLFDLGGYYSELISSADDAALEGFVRASQRGALVVARDLDELLRRLSDFRPPETRRAEEPPFTG